MKKLRKNQKKKTVAAYACNCGTPESCAYACAGDIVNLDTNASSYVNGLLSKK